MQAGLPLESAIAEIVSEIRTRERMKMELARRITGDPGASELLRRVGELTPAGISVCGIDGGLLQLSLSTLDIVVVRAVAAIFRYAGRSLVSVGYYPSERVPPHFFLLKEPLDSARAGTLAGMRRQMLEVSCATGVVRGGMADLVLLDGSVVPQYVERFSDSPECSSLYDELMEAYVGLYEEADDGRIMLAGFVKDSRGRRFCEILSERLNLDGEGRRFLSGSRDTAILDAILPKGWRTVAFPYAEESPQRPDLKGWGSRVYAFYMRVSEFDYPFRVEFLSTAGSPEEEADRISSLVGFLSSFGLNTSIPPVLVEADLRARLREEADWIQDRIVDRLGLGFLTRRDRRPF